MLPPEIMVIPSRGIDDHDNLVDQPSHTFSQVSHYSKKNHVADSFSMVNMSVLFKKEHNLGTI